METLWHDLRHGLRLLARGPGFAAVAVLTLALGIAANTAIFSLLNAFFLRPLPFRAPDRLVHVWQTDRERGHSELRVSAPNYLDWRAQNRVFEDMGGYFYQSVNLSGDGEPVQIQITRLTPGLIRLLGVEPILGRVFLDEEGEPGADRVVLVAHRFWQRHLAQDPQVVGKTVRLDDVPHTVVGVMPPDFVFPLSATQLWAPLPLDPWTSRREMNGPLMVVGRLGPEASLDEAQTELNAIMKRLEETYPQENQAKGARVVPLREALLFFHDLLQGTFALLFVGVGFLLLIVCANVGNLLLARAAGRSQEMAVRAALGSGRGRLVRQLLTESALLGLLGGAAGAFLAYWVVAIAGPLLPEDLYRVGEITVDGRALGFALAVSLVSAVLFGLAPALQSTDPRLSETLKEGGRGSSAGTRTGRLRSALVVAEVTLATLLLIGAALATRSFLLMQRLSPGFNPERVLTLETVLPEAGYSSTPERNVFYEAALDKVRALPGVRLAAAVYPLPLNFESLSVDFQVEGHTPGEATEKLFANSFWVTTGYFRVMDLPLLRGRDFVAADNDQGSPVVVVNRTMAERLWPNRDALGARLRLYPGTPNERLATVVGIVGDSKHFLMNEEPASLVYLPQLQSPTRRRFFVVKSDGDPLALAGSVRKEIWAVDPTLPVTTVRSMDQVLRESLGPWSGGTSALGLLGVGALVLAALGIYGVVSFSVEQRRHELGVHMALGAGRREVTRLVLGQGVRLAGAGLALGLVAALPLARLMAALLYGIHVYDPLTFAGVPVLLGAVALAACWIPARRAAGVEPIEALRYE